MVTYSTSRRREVYDDKINRHAEHVLRHVPSCHVCNSSCSRLIILINTPVLIQVSRVLSDQSFPVIPRYPVPLSVCACRPVVPLSSSVCHVLVVSLLFCRQISLCSRRPRATSKQISCLVLYYSWSCTNLYLLFILEKADIQHVNLLRTGLLLQPALRSKSSCWQSSHS